MTRLDPRRSPCRASTGGLAVGHPCSAAHAQLVEAYRLARHAWETAAEAAALHTPGRVADEPDELRAFRRVHPAPTFGAWLRDWHRRDDEAVA